MLKYKIIPKKPKYKQKSMLCRLSFKGAPENREWGFFQFCGLSLHYHKA
jgi:hypothetical protein